MDWKFLLGLELDDPGFDFSALSDFRARLIKHGLEEKVLGPVLERISALGLLRAAPEALAAAAPRWPVTRFVPAAGARPERGTGRAPACPSRQAPPPARLMTAVAAADGSAVLAPARAPRVCAAAPSRRSP
ncbi:transposase [Streptomyces sp. INA 01156]